MARSAIVLALGLACIPGTVLGASPPLTVSEAHAAVERDLTRHFGRDLRIQVWGCSRRSPTAIRCYTEFHRHHPRAVCVVHFEVARTRGDIVLAYRGLRPLFGTHCYPRSGRLRAHFHVQRANQ